MDLQTAISLRNQVRADDSLVVQPESVTVAELLELINEDREVVQALPVVDTWISIPGQRLASPVPSAEELAEVVRLPTREPRLDLTVFHSRGDPLPDGGPGSWASATVLNVSERHNWSQTFRAWERNGVFETALVWRLPASHVGEDSAWLNRRRLPSITYRLRPRHFRDRAVDAILEMSSKLEVGRGANFDADEVLAAPITQHSLDELVTLLASRLPREFGLELRLDSVVDGQRVVTTTMDALEFSRRWVESGGSVPTGLAHRSTFPRANVRVFRGPDSADRRAETHSVTGSTDGSAVMPDLSLLVGPAVGRWSWSPPGRLSDGVPTVELKWMRPASQ